MHASRTNPPSAERGLGEEKSSEGANLVGLGSVHFGELQEVPTTLEAPLSHCVLLEGKYVEGAEHEQPTLDLALGIDLSHPTGVQHLIVPETVELQLKGICEGANEERKKRSENV